MKIIVMNTNKPGEYEIWDVTNHMPENYVCDAPEGEELDAILEALSNGDREPLNAYVEENKE